MKGGTAPPLGDVRMAKASGVDAQKANSSCFVTEKAVRLVMEKRLSYISLPFVQALGRFAGRLAAAGHAGTGRKRAERGRGCAGRCYLWGAN